MNKLVSVALVAAQLTFAAQPAAAAGGEDSGAGKAGGFVGARLRLSFGGNPEDERLRAGLTIAPALYRQVGDRTAQARLGEGFELGLRADQSFGVSAGGRPLRFGAEHGAAAEEKLGVSTVGWIAIGVGAIAVIGTAALVVLGECHSDGTDCFGTYDGGD